MNTFESLVLNYVTQTCPDCKKYSPLGKTYYIDDENYKGNYWYYEGRDFIIDIHDFYVKRDVFEEHIPDMSNISFLFSKYLISGSGEWIDPYYTIEPNSMFIMDTANPLKNYILHGGSRYSMVGIMYKKDILKKYIVDKKNIEINDACKIFTQTKEEVIKPISKLAEEILNCKMDGVSAELFFEAKAREWLSITIDAYENLNQEKPLNKSDKEAIEKVASYINDHYSFDIRQELLENIATMSGTKLKESFKSVYNMSITEYIQRKRMNIAENLLLTTDLEIRIIAKSVGYNSPSRFSSLFKRYKGVYPKDIRKNSNSSNFHPCNCNRLK